MGTDEAKRRLERMAKLLEVEQDLLEKLKQCHDEMGKLVRGEQTTNDQLRAVEKTFGDEWTRRYGGPYMFQFAKDRPNWKRLLKGLSVEQVQQRILVYFNTPDDYVRRERHPFGLFVARFNSYAPEAAPEKELEAPTVADCKHQPPCKTDQQHTKRKVDDMKGGR